MFAPDWGFCERTKTMRPTLLFINGLEINGLRVIGKLARSLH